MLRNFVFFTMAMLEDCQEHFKTGDLYEIFRIEKNATPTSGKAIFLLFYFFQVKKAYYKLSMLYHPDKAENNENAKKVATVRFQLVTKIYAVLSDKERRKIYDDTG